MSQPSATEQPKVLIVSQKNAPVKVIPPVKNVSMLINILHSPKNRTNNFQAIWRTSSPLNMETLLRSRTKARHKTPKMETVIVVIFTEITILMAVMRGLDYQCLGTQMEILHPKGIQKPVPVSRTRITETHSSSFIQLSPIMSLLVSKAREGRRIGRTLEVVVLGIAFLLLISRVGRANNRTMECRTERR